MAESVEKILEYIEKEKPGIEIKETELAFIMPTICHNENYENASHKLYLYKNEDESNPLFHCYTECSETFNIYQLIIKMESLKGNEITYRDAYKIFNNGKELSQSFGDEKKEEIVERKILERFENPLDVKLPTYSENILDLFRRTYTDPWLLEGIDFNILDKFEIYYSRSLVGVIIPHRDWRGNLVGIRIRTYDENKVANFKYMPLLSGGIYYRHPLSLNFYGLFQNQGAIKKAKRVFLYEGEKSVLLHEMLNDDENISLAVCGKNISKWQMKILIYYLGVEEVIIGFDKEYDSFNFGSKYEYVENIKKKVEYLTNFAKVGILIDEENLFKTSESPVDRGREEFEAMTTFYI